MVITGVAYRIPDRIKRLIYVDALLPENGESADTCRHLTNSFHIPVTDGFIVPPWVQGNPPPPHDVAMPALCFSEPIMLTNQAVAQKLPTTYILTVDPGKLPEQDDFYRCYQRAVDRDWRSLIMTGDHNVQRSHPQEIVRLFEQAR
jgi:pimeloyl-ACP methyl ester carboxylesterase